MMFPKKILFLDFFTKHPVRIFFLVLLLVNGAVNTCIGQKKVDIIQANQIKGGTYKGASVQKILGDVHLKSKKLEMYCDSAFKFVNKSEIRAFGNIQINTQSEKIWADSVTYFTDVDFSKLRGRVIIDTDTTTLFGNSVDYRFSTKVAHFLDKIRLEDQRGTLLANSGYYYRKADSAQFIGDVQLDDSLKYLEGDSLFSNRANKHYDIFGNVFGNDHKNKTMIKGDYLESDSTGRRLLKGHAWLTTFKQKTDSSQKNNNAQIDSSGQQLQPVNADSSKMDSSKVLPQKQQAIDSDSLATSPQDSSQTSAPDTTHIRAHRILSIEHRSEKDTVTIIKSYQDVRIWSPEFSSVSDSARYNSESEIFQLWGKAKAWNKNVQLSGPYIFARLKNGHIDSLKSFPSPFIVRQDSVSNRLNQITGDTLFANFKSGNLSHVIVFNHAHVLQFTKNKQDSADGGIEENADTTNIYFQQGKIRRLSSYGNPQGNYLEEKNIDADKKIKGFSWDPKLRPHRPKEKMKRRLPPVPDSIFFKLPPRYILYLQRIDPGNPRIDSTRVDSSYNIGPPQPDTSHVDSASTDSISTKTSKGDKNS